jgi:peptide/nickel transport system substrate-binding protein
MRRSLQGAVMALTVLAMLALTPGVQSAGAASSKPVKGGNVTMIGADVASFNPALMGTLSTPGPTGFQVYDMLTVEDSATGEVQGRLLKSVTGSTDAMTWTMKLRPNVKFTDGTTLDAAAIKFNFDYAADPANKSTGVTLAQEIATWDVSDPLVAKLTLKAPDAAFGHSLGLRLGLVASPTAMQKFGSNYGSSPETTVGAGPFVLSQWVRGSQLVFTRNPNYWDAPKPYVDSVTIKVIPDNAAAYNTLLTGGADLWVAPTPDILNQGKAAGMKIEPFRFNAVTFRSVYRFNFAKPPFNDPIARQAMQIAVDPKKLGAALGLPPATALYDKDSPYYDPAGTLPKYDAKKAQDLINQWSAKNGGKPLEFTILVFAGNATLGGGGEALQATLAGYQNLKVNVQTVPLTQNASIGISGNFDLHPAALGGSDPDIPLRSALTSTGSQNYGKYSNPEMDAAIVAGASTTVEKERKKSYVTVQKLMVQDLPMWVMPIAQYANDQAMVANKSLKDVETGSWTGFQTQKLWIAKKK